MKPWGILRNPGPGYTWDCLSLRMPCAAKSDRWLYCLARDNPNEESERFVEEPDSAFLEALGDALLCEIRSFFACFGGLAIGGLLYEFCDVIPSSLSSYFDPAEYWREPSVTVLRSPDGSAHVVDGGGRVFRVPVASKFAREVFPSFQLWLVDFATVIPQSSSDYYPPGMRH